MGIRRRDDSAGDGDGVEEGKLKKGDLVLLAAVGAGFTVGRRCCGGRCQMELVELP
jgi:hypothetical protein